MRLTRIGIRIYENCLRRLLNAVKLEGCGKMAVNIIVTGLIESMNFSALMSLHFLAFSRERYFSNATDEVDVRR